MFTIFYIAAACFGVIICPSWGCWHKNVCLLQKFWCQLPEEGEIIALKHAGAV